HVAYSDGALAKVDGSTIVALDGSPTHGQALASVGNTLVLGDLEGLYRVDDARSAASSGAATGRAPEGSADRHGATFTQLASVDARGIASSGDTIALATYGGGFQTGALRGALSTDPSVAKLARGVGA